MQQIIDQVKQLFAEWKGEEPQSLDVLPISGSERRYFRLHSATGSVIGTYGANVRENETFIYFSKHFLRKNLPACNILAVSDDVTAYLQEDFGDTSLLDKLETLGYSDEVYGLFKLSLEKLAELQVKGDEGLNYNL